GCSITTCLLMAGHPVVALAPIVSDLENAGKRILQHLQNSRKEDMIEREPAEYLENLRITSDYQELKMCRLVIECTIENMEIKESVFKKIESVISADAL